MKLNKIGILVLSIVITNLIWFFIAIHKNNKIHRLEVRMEQVLRKQYIDSLEASNAYLEVSNSLIQLKVMSEQMDSLRLINSKQRENERIKFLENASDSVIATTIDNILAGHRSN